MAEADSPTDNETESKSWWRRAKKAENDDDFEQARAICQEAAKEAEQAGDDRDASAAHHQAAGYAYLLDDYDAAELAFRRSLAFDERTGDELGSARTFNNLSGVASRRGDHDRALNLLFASMHIKERHGDKSGVALSLLWLGNAAASNGDGVAAETWYRRSIAAYEALGDNEHVAMNYLALHQIAEEEDARDPQAWFDQAMHALDRSGDVYAAIRLGKMTARGDNPDEARVLFDKAVELGRKQDDESKLALALRYVSHSAVKKEDPETAISSMEEALAIEERLGLEERVASGREWLDRHTNPISIAMKQGIEAQRREATEEAFAYYREAITLAEDRGDDAKLARGLHCLGALAANTHDFDTARGSFERALAIEEQAGNDEWIAGNRRWLKWLDQGNKPANAALYRGIKAENQNETEEALGCYRKSIEFAEREPDEETLASGLQYLGALAGKTGDRETAQECFERALAIGERIGNDEVVASNRRWLEWLDKTSDSSEQVAPS